MSAVLRVAGWAWLFFGWFAVLSLALTRIGSAVPLPPKLAMLLSQPWSQLIPILSMSQTMALAVMAIGVFINAQILFVIGNVLKR